jgi:catechol 2,3-dioxygenase-like lactoylglutathione lyase family enzyme
MRKNICGIQQIGVGVSDAQAAWKWYRQQFGMDIKVFEDTAVAELMLPHTDNQTRERYAALAMNFEGGGGFEIWQHTGMESRPPVFDVQMGDLGIGICKLKCRDVGRAYATHKERGLDVLGDLSNDPNGNPHYYIRDPYNNIFEVVANDNSYRKQKSLTGGVLGAVIGVSNMDEAKKVYADILEYDDVVFDQTENFKDFNGLPGAGQKYRRVLLRHSKNRMGPFSNLLGPTEIELVQAIDRPGRKIYEDRIWGELGFIHLCFDIIGMNHLKSECKEKGFPFTVDSSSDSSTFDMGKAAGSFSYIEDKDGTLIEFVETHKIPIMERLGIYMDVTKRDQEKPLPDWMLSFMKFGRVKD